jgi:hypothetical protein
LGLSNPCAIAGLIVLQIESHSIDFVPLAERYCTPRRLFTVWFYVADYSRYLPATVPAARTFWYTGLGCFLGSFLIMAFGAYFSTLEPALARNPGVGWKLTSPGCLVCCSRV